MEGIKSKIGNAPQPIYDNIAPENIYFLDFGDYDDMDDPPLPYMYEIINAKTDEINKAWIGVVDHYICTEVVVPKKESTLVLENIIKRKCDNQGNPIGK